MSSTKVSSVCSKLLLRSGNLSRLTLWWVTADRWLTATSTPSSKSLIYKKEKKTSSSPIMWHRYAKRTIGWLCPSSSRCKEVRGQVQRDRGRTMGTVCTCEEIERGTHACRASQLGPVERWWTQDGKLGITIQDPPLESGRRTHLLHFTHSYCILSRVWKPATLLLVLRHYGHPFLFSMLILQVTSSRICLYLLNIYHLTCTFSHAHTKAHWHTQAHMYNQHTRGMATNRHRSLVERGGRKALLEALHTQKRNVRKKLIFTNLKKELPAKLLDYFLRSNRSNINPNSWKTLSSQLTSWNKGKVEAGKDDVSALTWTCKRCFSSNKKLGDRAREFIESTLTFKTPSTSCLTHRSGSWWECLKFQMLTSWSTYMKKPRLDWPQTMEKVR